MRLHWPIMACMLRGVRQKKKYISERIKGNKPDRFLVFSKLSFHNVAPLVFVLVTVCFVSVNRISN